MKDWLGNEIPELQLINGTMAMPGDVIRWNVWDDEERTTWSFTAAFYTQCIVYLGGGIDFGMGIGDHIELPRIIEDAANNDEGMEGVRKVGVVSDLESTISAFGE
jgi:hypothetical protein